MVHVLIESVQISTPASNMISLLVCPVRCEIKCSEIK